MNIRKPLAFLIFMVVSLFCLPSFAYDSKRSPETLRGIEDFRVVVEQLPPDMEQISLTKELLRTDVEIKLRIAGIKVSDESAPFLYVNVNIAYVGNEIYFLTINIEFHQPVYLRRNSFATFGSTWSSEGFGPAHQSDGVRKKLEDYMDIFINAYLSVNPK